MRRTMIRLTAGAVMLAALATVLSRPNRLLAETASACITGAANEGCMQCDPEGGCSFTYPLNKSNGDPNSWTCVSSPGHECSHGNMHESGWTDES